MDCFEIYFVITAIISVLGLIGNGITFCTFGKVCTENASTFLLRSLACVDSFLLITSTMRLTLQMIYSGGFWILAAMVCIMDPLREIARAATIWTILLVGVHRYIVVCKPLMAASLCTVGNARRHFLAVILFVLAANFPLFFSYKVTERQVTLNSTDYNETYVYVADTNMKNSLWFSVLYDLAFRSVTVNYVIPVGSLIFITVKLLQSLHSLQQRLMELSEGRRKRYIRSECMVIVILIVFLLCHTSLPIALVLDRVDMLWDRDTPYCKTVYFCLFTLSHCMILLNSSVNIIIYLVFNSNFRRALCQQLRSVTNPPNQQHWHTEYHPRLKLLNEYHAWVNIKCLCFLDIWL